MRQRITTMRTGFQCSLWGEEFRTESPLTEQMKKCNSGKRHRCTECDETFITKWAFALHKQQHEGHIVYSQCETSDGISDSQWEMKSYIQNGEDKRYQCSFCDASFTQNITLLQHEVEHEPEVTHQCTMCDKVFKQRFACELHIRTNHGGSAPRILTNFHCKVCDKSFPDESECTDHMKNCRDKNEEIYDCAECSAVFSHQSWLDEHKVFTPRTEISNVNCATKYS